MKECKWEFLYLQLQIKRYQAIGNGTVCPNTEQ